MEEAIQQLEEMDDVCHDRAEVKRIDQEPRVTIRASTDYAKKELKNSTIIAFGNSDNLIIGIDDFYDEDGGRIKSEVSIEIYGRKRLV